MVYSIHNNKERDSMTDSQKLDLLISEIQGMKSDITNMKSDITDMKSGITDMKSGMADMKSNIKDLESEIHNVNQKLTDTRLHIENVTDKNIQLIAENFIELTKKLNQAIPVADKNLAYEVKVNYLVAEVDKLKKEINELKSKIA